MDQHNQQPEEFAIPQDGTSQESAETAEQIEKRRREWRERKQASRQRQREAAEAEARENVGGPIDIFCNECGYSSVLAGYWKQPDFDFKSILRSVSCPRCNTQSSFVEADDE